MADHFSRHSWVLRYGITVLCVLLALAFREALDPFLGDSDDDVTFFLAVAAAAWFGGFGPALLATALGYLAADWFFIPPRYSLFVMTLDHAVDMAAYWIVCVAIAIFSHSLHRSRALALSRQSQLEQEIERRKQVEALLQEAKDLADQSALRESEANHAKDHFLALLSHELRNPLTPVLATTSLLQQDGRLDEQTQEHLEVIHRNAELEARLIDDLLDVTRIARGKLVLDRRPVDLSTIIRRAVEVCQVDIEARDQHFKLEIKDPPHLVDADATRLQQVFWNLIKNAVKFTPHGGCVSIKVMREIADCQLPIADCPSEIGNVVVEVVDNGMGINPDALARIFNAFEQAERSITRQFGGLGLGLAITKALVELHGGTISAHSRGKDQGATFTVRLPLGARAPAPAIPDHPKPITGGDTCAPRLRILLVEDHGDTARIMSQLLQRQGHRVCTAGDVASALSLASSETLDLLISDLSLPDGNGIDLIGELRARGHTFPAIAISGYGQDQDIQQSRAAGFTAHLIKPVDLPHLTEAIATMAGVRAS